MSRNLAEDSPERRASRNEFGTRQLFRRPAPVAQGTAIYAIEVFEVDRSIVVGDRAFEWEIPEDLDQSVLIKVEGYINTAGTGATEIQLRNRTTSADMLSTKITIDSGEIRSKDAAVQPVIDAGQDTVSWGDMISVDVDAAATGGVGMGVICYFAPSDTVAFVLEGSQGPPGGIVEWTGEWVTSTAYTENQAVSHNGSSYVAIQDHTSGAASEPGVGVDWEDFWMLLAEGTAGLFDAYAIIRDEKTANTAGGAFTSGSWQKRTLNTIASDPDGIVISLSASQFVLDPGTYLIRASAPAYRVDRHKAKLRDVTAGSDAIIGTSEYSNSSNDYASNRSFVTGRITIAAQTTFELQHRCGTTNGTNGFGVESNFGVTEVYSEVEIWHEP